MVNKDAFKAGKVLAIDTAMNGCSVAIYDSESDQCHYTSRQMSRGQAEALAPMIAQTIEMAGADKREIGLVAVTTGPGAFTGLRVGLSTARVFALALGVPVAGMTTLEILARQCLEAGSNDNNKNLLILIETRRNDYYGQLFSSKGNSISEPFAAGAGLISQRLDGPACIGGDGAERFIREADQEFAKGLTMLDINLVDPCVLARSAYRLWLEGRADINPEPLYIREADVSCPKKPVRLVNF